MVQKRLHLPDCAAIRYSFGYECNCGKPRHPLPSSSALVGRYDRGLGRRRLRVIPRTKLKKNERNLVETRLVFLELEPTKSKKRMSKRVMVD